MTCTLKFIFSLYKNHGVKKLYYDLFNQINKQPENLEYTKETRHLEKGILISTRDKLSAYAHLSRYIGEPASIGVNSIFEYFNKRAHFLRIEQLRRITDLIGYVKNRKEINDIEITDIYIEGLFDYKGETMRESSIKLLVEHFNKNNIDINLTMEYPLNQTNVEELNLTDIQDIDVKNIPFENLPFKNLFNNSICLTNIEILLPHKDESKDNWFNCKILCLSLNDTIPTPILQNPWPVTITPLVI